MKLVLLPVALLAYGASEPDPVVRLAPAPLAPPQCDDDTMHLAQEQQTLRPQRLGDLPAAKMERAVLYREDGCTVPVIVKEEVGR